MFSTGKAEQAKQLEGFASLNSVGGLWSIGVVSSCLGPGLGDLGQGEYWLDM